EADDPTLKDLVRTIGRLCESSKSSRVLIGEVAEDLFKDLAELRESLQRGAEKSEIEKKLDDLRRDQELLEKALKSYGRM
ncbi:MAG TPA: hypothetical protein VIX18_02410, partial [Nitrospirota bacterium]